MKNSYLRSVINNLLLKEEQDEKVTTEPSATQEYESSFNDLIERANAVLKKKRDVIQNLNVNSFKTGSWNKILYSINRELGELHGLSDEKFNEVVSNHNKSVETELENLFKQPKIINRYKNYSQEEVAKLKEDIKQKLLEKPWDEWKDHEDFSSETKELDVDNAAPPQPDTVTDIGSETMKWIPWSEEAKKYYKTCSRDGECFEIDGKPAKKVGPGEYSIYVQFGGCEVQGPSVEYDIVQKIGGKETKWEVKEVSKGKLRTSISGIVASSGPRFEINQVLKKVRDVIKNIKADEDFQTSLSNETKNRINIVSRFVESNMESIFSKAEITKERFRDMFFMLQHCQKIRDSLNSMSMGSGPNMISIQGKDVPISSIQFHKVLRVLGREDEFEVKSNPSDMLSKRAASYAIGLEDPAIDDPNAFVNSMKESLSAKKSFGDVDGVILVTNQQFIVVPLEQTQAILDFDGITQGGRTFYSVKKKDEKKDTNESVLRNKRSSHTISPWRIADVFLD